MKILKCIKTVYPVDRNTQLVTHLAYGRQPYQGYGMSDYDEIDLAVFDVIERGSKRLSNGGTQTFWYRSELDQGWPYYLTNIFKAMHRHQAEILINPTLPPGAIDPEKIDQSKLQQTKVQVTWVNNKIKGNESLVVQPVTISFSLQYDLLHKLSLTLLPPF